MSNENNNQNDNSGTPRPRRGSFTSTTFNTIFGRSNSVSGGQAGVAAQPIPTGQQRRMSITTLGLSGTSPIQQSSFGFPGGRRASVSTTSSDSIDENAVDDDEGPGRSMPNTPFSRRMSFGAQALLAARPGGSPGTSGRAPSSPLASIPDQNARQKKKTSQSQASSQSKSRTASDYSNRSAEGLNWSEQFRSRAESTVARPSFSFGTSPPANNPSRLPATHDRAKSVSEMSAPPTTALPAAPPPQSALRRKPDDVGERMLRGEFYMD